jgi:hypothetical protein
MSNDNTGINAATVATVAADAANQEAKARRAAKLKAGAIGTGKALGYMAAGAAITIGVQQFQARRNRNGQEQVQGQ